MKTTTTRSLVCLLLVCLLMTILPLGVFAAPTYSWEAAGADSAFDTAYKAKEIVTNFVSVDASNKQKDTYYQFGLDNKAQASISFYGIQFNTVKAGTYNVTFKLADDADTNDYTVHVFPTSFFSDCANTSSRNTKTNDAIAAGSHKVATISVTKGDASVSFSAEMGEAPVIVFSAPENGVKKFFRFSEVSFTEDTSAPKPTTPATEPSTTPATEPATQPATQPATTPNTTAPTTSSGDTGADNGGLPVAAIVAIVVVVIAGAVGAVIVLKKKKA